jgi:Ca-activated chloride channel family protein
MKLKPIIIIHFILVCFFIGIPSTVIAADSKNLEDQTGAPYFFVHSQDPEIDALPLKSTDVKVHIAGVIADVTVIQEYQNQGQKPLEAVYVFPASTRAAVYGMTMRIGERTIVAKIDERSAARQSYEEAKNAGQSASLLEQQRPNVFQMNVANILPGDIIKVELKYTELLIPKDAVYEFVYPTVVGPRYTGPQGDFQKPAENWTQNPCLHEGEPAKTTLGIDVHINAGLPIAKVSCDTHKTNINFDGKNAATVNLNASEKFSGNKDFIIKYQLAGGRIESGLLLYEGEKENFFLLMMQPPEKIKASAIPPREYVFIVDISGSMHGFPLDTSKALLKNLIGSLRPADRFNVLLFAGSAAMMAEHSLPATSQNIQKAIQVIEQQQGGGGTELLPAMRKALDMKGAEGVSRTLVIATDGYVTVEKETFDLTRSRLGDANLFAFGIGSSVNRFLIEGMARAGMGEPFIVTRPEDASHQAEKFKNLIQTPALTDIHVNYGKFKVFDVEPPSIPDLFANRPVIVFGKYTGKASGSITLSGTTGEKPYEFKVDLKDIQADPRNSALRYLWARHRIAVLADDNALSADDARAKEATRLGLDYNLLTEYTSFVAIDSLKRTDGKETTTVKQPLPLPEGVSDYAVGNAASKSMAMMQTAPMPGQAMGRGLNETKERTGPPAELEKDEAAVDLKIALKHVAAPQGILMEILRTTIEPLNAKILSCLENANQDLSTLNGCLNLNVQVDQNGHVLKVTIDEKNGSISDELKTCITTLYQTLTLPASSDISAYNLEIIYEIRHSKS